MTVTSDGPSVFGLHRLEKYPSADYLYLFRAGKYHGLASLPSWGDGDVVGSGGVLGSTSNVAPGYRDLACIYAMEACDNER